MFEDEANLDKLLPQPLTTLLVVNKNIVDVVVTQFEGLWLIKP